MSQSFSFMMAVAGAWLAIGLVLSLVMGRRGHSGFSWLILGAVLGPLAVVLAVSSKRHDETLRPTPVGEGRGARAGSGPVDVLIGYDGSPESVAAIDAAGRLLGERLGRYTVAAVIPFDGGTAPEKSATAALQRLRERLATSGGRIPSVDVLHGRPADALREWATQAGYDLIVVGARGTGLATRVLGSAATSLATRSKVPVLIVGER